MKILKLFTKNEDPKTCEICHAPIGFHYVLCPRNKVAQSRFKKGKNYLTHHDSEIKDNPAV